MRYVLSLALVLLVMGSPSAVKADTFDFSFTSVTGDFSGSGSFDTLPYATDYTGDPVAYSGFYISSLDGEVNGILMLLAPGISRMDYSGPLQPIPGVPLALYTEYNFLNGSFNFTLDGQAYFIHDNDMGPDDLIGLNLYGPGLEDLIMMTVIPTPEPATRLCLCFGLLLVAAFAFKGRGNRFLAALRT